MKKKKFWLLLAVLILLNVGVLSFASIAFKAPPVTSFEECAAAGNEVMESYPPQCRSKDGKSFTQNIGNEMEMREKIMIDTPRPNAVISSPLKITGKARGTWFFEAQFSAKLLDGNNKELGMGIMKANSEWMTENFVPFSGEIKFKTPQTGKGTLILEKSNPSGLEENAEHLSLPVKFK
jgi:hypothetical protein